MTMHPLLSTALLLPVLAACADAAPDGGWTETAPVYSVSQSTPTPSPAVSGGAAGARRLEVVPAETWVAEGATTTLSADLVDERGGRVRGVRVAWRSLDPTVATVGEDGAVRGVAAGTARVEARLEEVADTARVTVGAPGEHRTREVGTETGAPPTRVRLQVVRLGGGSGSALVSSGVPLAPGMLMPGEVGQVRLFVGGQEQSVYVEALGGRHNDGSVRSVLVQFQASVGSSPLDAELVLGSARGTPDRSKQAVALTLSRPLPEAVALPSDPAYLISTRLVGPTIAASANSFSPSYERKFATVGGAKAAVHRRDYRSAPVDHVVLRDYYDRSLAHFAHWVRSAEPEQFRMGVLYALAYHLRYGAPNQYRVQPHNAQIEGVALTYLLTGDEGFRTGVAQNAALFRDQWLPYLSNKDAPYTEDRPKARTIEAFLMARQVGVPGDWEDLLRQALTAFLAHQSADGAYRYPVGCNTSSNFQSGLFNDALIRYAEEFENDPRILPAVRRWVDWLWSTQWVASAGAFKYHEQECQAPGGFNGTNPAPDLNLLIVNAFGWVYQQTGDATYRQRGDTVFREGVERSWLGSNAQQADKQFTQQYRSAFRYLAYRR